MPLKKPVTGASLADHQNMTGLGESSLKFTCFCVLDETVCPSCNKKKKKLLIN